MAKILQQQLVSPTGSPNRRANRLQSPEPSGTPKLKKRQSHRGQDRHAYKFGVYTSKESSPQDDDWPSNARRSEDILVRYKPAKTRKMLMEGEDNSHKWSDLATDSEAEEAQKSTFLETLDLSRKRHLKQTQAEVYPQDLDDELDGSEDSESSMDETSIQQGERLPAIVREVSKDSTAPIFSFPVELQTGGRQVDNVPPVTHLSNFSNGDVEVQAGSACPKGNVEEMGKLRSPPSKEEPMLLEERGALQITRSFESNCREADWAKCKESVSSHCIAAQETKEDGDIQGEEKLSRSKWKEESKLSLDAEKARVNFRVPAEAGEVEKTMMPAGCSFYLDGYELACETDPRPCKHEDSKQECKEIILQETEKMLIIKTGKEAVPKQGSAVIVEKKKKETLRKCQAAKKFIARAANLHSSSPLQSSPLRLHVHGNEELLPSGADAFENVRGSVTSISSQSISDSLQRTKDAADKNTQAHVQTSSMVEEGSEKPIRETADAESTSQFDNQFLELIQKVTGAPLRQPIDGVTPSSLPLAVLKEPTALKVSDLQKKVEELKAQVTDERRQRQLVAQRLADQRREAESSGRQKQEHWDAKFRELHKEKYALSIRLQSTETAHLASLLAGRGSLIETPQSISGAPQRRLPSGRQCESPITLELEAEQPWHKLKMGGEKVQLTAQEVRILRQEILEQEALIRGYQHENEKAVGKLKEVQTEARERAHIMAEKNAMLASQLANLQMTGGRQSVGYEPGSLPMKENLQDTLAREAKLRADLDKMRQAYVELEKRVAEGDSKRVADLESEGTVLRERLEEERQSHTRTAASREGKVQTLLEHQEIFRSLHSTIEEQGFTKGALMQAAEISELMSRLANLEGEKTGRENGLHTPFQEQQDSLHNGRAAKRIETLQKQVKRLEAALKVAKKEPNSLPALAQASKSGIEESDKVRRLQAELVALQRQAVLKEDETNRILHHMKLEHDKMKHESIAQIRNLKQQLQAKLPLCESEQAAANHVKDLEKQVANVRIYYAKKVKELTDKLEEIRNENVKTKLIPERSGHLQKSNTQRPVKELSAKDRIALQEDVIAQKDKTIKTLQHNIRALESGEKVVARAPPLLAPLQLTLLQPAKLISLSNTHLRLPQVNYEEINLN